MPPCLGSYAFWEGIKSSALRIRPDVPAVKVVSEVLEGLLCHVGDVVAGLGCHTTLHDDLMAAATMMTTCCERVYVYAGSR